MLRLSLTLTVAVIARTQQGCLSIPHLRGNVWRHRDIAVEFVGRDGRAQRGALSLLAARVFQHELDHLNGVLFTDRIKQEDAAKDLIDLRTQRMPELEAATAGDAAGSASGARTARTADSASPNRSAVI